MTNVFRAPRPKNQDRHGSQTSATRGAAASQLGPNVHAASTMINKATGPVA